MDPATSGFLILRYCSVIADRLGCVEMVREQKMVYFESRPRKVEQKIR